MCVCVYVCVCEREREREKKNKYNKNHSLNICWLKLMFSIPSKKWVKWMNIVELTLISVPHDCALI